MNFQDLYKKIAAIEEGSMPPVAPVHTDGPSTDECGDMMGPSDPPKQQDNVTMNVSMNGSGAGGIRDLMGILKNIEAGGDAMDPHPHHVDKLFGDDYENSPEGGSDPEVYGIDAVTQTGNDMHSKGIEEPKVSGGGNPMQEALVNRLASMYEEIAGRRLGSGAGGAIKMGVTDLTRPNDPAAAAAAHQVLNIVSKDDPSVDTSNGITQAIMVKARAYADKQYMNGGEPLAGKQMKMLFQQATGLSL